MATPSEILANIFGGQTAKPMSDEERGMAAMGQNPAITTPEPFQPTGGAGFIPQAQVPTPAADVGRGTIMGDLANILPDAPQQFTPAATTQAIEPQSPTIGQGTVLQSPAVPSMESVGLNPLTTEPQFGGISQTPSLQPTNNVMGEAATQARLGAMFGEAPQTLSQVTAQDPASIAAQQATQAFEAESAAREARLDARLSDRAMARQSQRGAKPELTAEERQAEAEAQIAEAKAEAARQALQDPNISDYEKFTSELELSDLTPQQRRAATLKRFGLNPLDYPEGGEGVSTAETQDAGSTPATSINVEALSGDDKQAYEWAQANKDDPRAKQILDRLSAK